LKRLRTGDSQVDLLLDGMGLRLGHLRKATTRVIEALDAERGEGQVDHSTRLRAAEHLHGLVGLRASRQLADAADAARPVAVNIVLAQVTNGHPRSPLQADGIRLHLSDGTGDGA
jgi:hypothetical protein